MLIEWTPKTNTQRGAFARFPAWELSPGPGGSFPTALHVRGAGLCRLIQPVGDHTQARWVSVEQIRTPVGVE